MNKESQLDIALKACELIVAVKHCMMFNHIHADWAVEEVLAKHGFKTIQDLAHEAEEIAELAIKHE